MRLADFTTVVGGVGSVVSIVLMLFPPKLHRRLWFGIQSGSLAMNISMIFMAPFFDETKVNIHGFFMILSLLGASVALIPLIVAFRRPGFEPYMGGTAIGMLIVCGTFAVTAQFL